MLSFKDRFYEISILEQGLEVLISMNKKKKKKKKKKYNIIENYKF